MADRKDAALAGAVTEFIASASQPAEVESWAERITAQLLAQNPEIAADAVLTQLVRSAVRSHWLTFLVSLAEPQREIPLVQPAVEFAAELARRGHQVTVLFGVYRLAQQAVWGYITSMIETSTEPGLDKEGFLMLFWGRVSAWLDSSIEASVDIFQSERERVLQGAAAQKLEAVRSVLAGKSPEIRELSAVLGGHPLSTYNTAVLLHTEDVDRIPDLAEAVSLLAQRIGARNPLVINPGGRDLWCWFASRAAPDLTAMRDCAPWLTEHQVSVAVGTPLEGLDGFRLGHLEAQQAQSIAFRANLGSPLTVFPEVEALALLATTPDAAERFVRRTLGGLADDGDGPTRLRQTFHALLSSGSVEEASRRLSVHKNTVRYRVSQAEALLGRPVGWNGAEVEIAIRYYDAFLAQPADT